MKATGEAGVTPRPHVQLPRRRHLSFDTRAAAVEVDLETAENNAR
jgi:hypothetical protein